MILHEQKIQHSEMTNSYNSLPKSKSFPSYLLKKVTWEREKSSIFALYCFACFWSRTLYLSRWWHKSMHSSNKLSADTVLCTHGLSVLRSCQLHVMIYRIMYRGVALVSRYVLYHEKLYCCNPSMYQ